MRSPSPTGSALIAIALWVLVAFPAAADIPCLPEEYSDASGAGGTILVSPDGTGETLAEIGSVITVHVRGCGGAPVENFPRQDVWLGSSFTDAFLTCQPGTIADQDTDADGMTTISGSLAGGGNTQGPLMVYIAGSGLYMDPIDLEIVSPDINGDLVVNLVDVGTFAGDYGSGSYQSRSDFNHDGTLNLADIGIFATYLGASCP